MVIQLFIFYAFAYINCVTFMTCLLIRSSAMTIISNHVLFIELAPLKCFFENTLSFVMNETMNV